MLKLTINFGVYDNFVEVSRALLRGKQDPVG